MAIARDKFWLFGVRPHQDDVLLGWAKGKGKRKHMWSRITPAEGAFMLDIPNVMMIVCDGQPANFSAEAYGYAESFIRMKNVQWSVTGSGGFSAGNEEAFICKLAEEYPNVTGAFLDDFFADPYKTSGDTPAERDKYAKARMEDIAEKLKKAPRPLDIHIVYYDHSMDMDLSIFDKVTTLSLWTWESEKLANLEDNFLKMEKQFPDKKKMIGIYMFDFPNRCSIPIELMEHQCNFALRMLKEGRIDGIIFEANSVMGIGLESELWLRNWIEENKNTVVPD